MEELCQSPSCCKRHPRSPRCRSAAGVGERQALPEGSAAPSDAPALHHRAKHVEQQTLEWVCARAAQARSGASCARCGWWTPRALVTAAPKLLPQALATTVWMLCVAKPTPADGQLSSRHLELATAAVASARLHAPSLAPYVLYLHRPAQELRADDPFTRRLHALGARVVPHRLSFYEHIPTSKLTGGSQKHLNFGAFGRLDIPLVVESLRPELRQRGLDVERVLYTDTDVLFAADFDASTRARYAPLKYFAVGSEVFSPTLNSGVMYLNVSAMATEWPGMLEYAKRRHFKFHLMDQTLLRDWFETSRCQRCKSLRRKHQKVRRRLSPVLDVLDDATYNARGFIHPIEPSARDSSRIIHPHIWHWHGYKPHDVSCWMSAIQSGKWPAESWLDHPVRGTGCRYFDAISMGSCYLRTYVYLLVQHKELIRFASTFGVPMAMQNRTS
ncbi:hypothetical protein AB1Y20_020864 [Prymnesium parvum]|uniref:Protein xylosyltransferase n=1 Tax=Prymnesium parvum TaxID=97485 RepID=A0AB34JYN7_PRYPA